MLSAVQAIAPRIVTNTVFPYRRTEKAFDNNNSIILNATNGGIASGQLLNGAKGVADMARESNNMIAKDIISAEEQIKKISKSGKIIGGASKVIEFIADHINPVICLAGGIKVLTSDNKQDALIEEATALGSMFAFEGAAKAVLGMPKNYNLDDNKVRVIDNNLYTINDGKKKLLAESGKYKIINKKVIVSNDGLYKKNLFLKEQSKALKDYFSTKHLFNRSLKYVPAALKGVGFVCASIGGYALGSKIGNFITDKVV